MKSKKQDQGKPTKAVIYCRVSSDRQAREGDGLRSQETSCRVYAEQRGLRVVKVFHDEGVSGGLGPDERPAAREMFAFLDTQRERFCVVVDDVNRVARSHKAHIEFRTKLNLRGAELISPTHTFGTDPHDLFITDVLVSVGAYQREENKVRVKNRQHSRLLGGFWTFVAPPGYKYVKDIGGGKILVRDEPKATHIAEALEGYATGRFDTQTDVAAFLTRSGAFKRRVQKSRIQPMLTNIFYTGQLEYPAWDVSLRDGRHPALINISTFHKIQERLGLRAKAPYRRNLREDFPLRGFVLCAECGEPVTSGWSTGRGGVKHPYYHCKSKDCGLYGKTIKRDAVESAFECLLKKMKPSEAVLNLARQITQDCWREKVGQFNKQQSDMDRTIKDIDHKIDGFMGRLLDAKDPIIIQVYENHIKALETQRQLLAAQGREMYKIDTSFETALGTIFDFLGNPHGLWANGDFEDKKLVLKLAFAEPMPFDREAGFGTAPTSCPFKVLSNLEGQKREMVEEAGFEPT